MKDESSAFIALTSSFIAFILHPFQRRRSQVVRQRSAKPLFIGSIPIAASNPFNNLALLFQPSKFRVLDKQCGKEGMA